MKLKIPPIKIQGIKTKLVPFILSSINWDRNGTYFEPFMGSGVVGFNLEPKKAIFSDTNPHIIQFYKDIQSGKINSKIVREYLEKEGNKLSQSPENKESYYYEVRKRFNKCNSPLDFLFLQRSNFNGLIRFNSKGEYNVPFGRKPNRFNKALITKIVNQVMWIEELFKDKDWKFICMSFEEAFKLMKKGDFVYLDPPYIGRYDGYFDLWDENKADLLIDLIHESKAEFAYSMWKENKFRENLHLYKLKKGQLLTYDHFYHIGAKENNRNRVVEALIVSEGND